MKKKILALLTACAMIFTGCSVRDTAQSINNDNNIQSDQIASNDTSSDIENVITEAIENTEGILSDELPELDENQEIEWIEQSPVTDIDIHSEEYIQSLGLTSLKDPKLLNYVEETVYFDLANQLDPEKYVVEDVQAVYISKEYIDELSYNSQKNVYFGFTLAELDQQFQGDKFIFTLGDNGQTVVEPFEEYDDTYDQVIRNVAIGTGVILLCVTVSVVTGGLGAPAVSMIFAASAKSAAVFALSSGAIGGVAAGVTEGLETHDFDKAVKAGALAASKDFKTGAIIGAATGGASNALLLKSGTKGGLTMNEVASLIKEYNYPINVIKMMASSEEAAIYGQKAGLVAKSLEGQSALIRSIDLKYESELAGKTVTNLERMKKGYAAIDPLTGEAYELHHIGQNIKSPLAILTQAEHRGAETNSILHNVNIANGQGVHSLMTDAEWAAQRKAFWEALAKFLEKAGGVV